MFNFDVSHHRQTPRIVSEAERIRAYQEGWNDRTTCRAYGKSFTGIAGTTEAHAYYEGWRDGSMVNPPKHRAPSAVPLSPFAASPRAARGPHLFIVRR